MANATEATEAIKLLALCLAKGAQPTVLPPCGPLRAILQFLEWPVQWTAERVVCQGQYVLADGDRLFHVSPVLRAGGSYSTQTVSRQSAVPGRLSRWRLIVNSARGGEERSIASDSVAIGLALPEFLGRYPAQWAFSWSVCDGYIYCSTTLCGMAPRQDTLREGLRIVVEADMRARPEPPSKRRSGKSTRGPLYPKPEPRRGEARFLLYSEGRDTYELIRALPIFESLVDTPLQLIVGLTYFDVAVRLEAFEVE
eukprot:TRINITY_DN13089_c0_g1_i1.p1 TRINITY_DN13089_c0_g1~~TRINITY_DN13089_c0_g1_i1.p1  ORF type:complete len:254 (+),score=24.60 TRINITY_DN13089_c0_g1_i1:39-800(+)